MIEQSRHGNWSVRTGFVLNDLAFIEQISGGNERLALKQGNGEWKSFGSISFYHMLEHRGKDACREFVQPIGPCVLSTGFFLFSSLSLFS